MRPRYMGIKYAVWLPQGQLYLIECLKVLSFSLTSNNIFFYAPIGNWMTAAATLVQ